MAKVAIKNNSPVTIHGLKPGNTMTIEVDRKGKPLDRNWRRRLADSPIDGAITVVVQAEPQKKKPSKKEKED